MASSNDHKMKLKLVVDKKRNKVAYAEAKKDFVDLLIYLLSLPLSAVVKYSTSAAVTPSSLVNLHSSVEAIMNAGYIKTQHDEVRWDGHSSILVPQLLTLVPVLPPLSSPSDSSQKKTLYICKNNNRYVTNNIKTYLNCKLCGHRMDHEVEFAEFSSSQTMNADYVKDMFTFMVADNLCVSALDTASVFAALKGCYIGDMVEKEVQFGTKEVVELLNATLHSDSPLTSVFLKPSDQSKSPSSSSSSSY